MPGEVGKELIDISPAQDKGVLKEIIKPGTGDGTPTPGCTVNVHYTGTLLDGTQFDSSRDRGPFSFNLGQGQVIKAWDIGVATMKKGEVCKLTCAPQYAYGESGSGGTIPPNSTLIFEVEMIDWQLEDLLLKGTPGQLLRQILVPGDDSLGSPTSGSTVDVHLTGEIDGKVFDDRDVSFALGEGSEDNICKGIEKALLKFKLNEKSRLEIKSKYGFGTEGNSQLNVPPNADLVYTVTLKSFTKLKDNWALDDAEKISHAKIFKEKGLKYINSGKYGLAFKMYKKMAGYVDQDVGFSKETEEERKVLAAAAHSNSALCLLKLEKYKEAQEQCDEVLKVDPNNVKALFRKGQAYLGLRDAELAKENFDAVLKLDPSNKAAASGLAQCNKTIREQIAKEKQIYTNMFTKFAKKDQEERDWRFGWWDGKHVNVEKIESDPEDEEEIKERKREKKKQLEIMKQKAAEVRERRERERLEERKKKEEEEKLKEKENLNENETENKNENGSNDVIQENDVKAVDTDVESEKKEAVKVSAAGEIKEN